MRIVQRSNSNPHVVMFVDAWFPLLGGGQVHVWELSKALSDLDFHVTVFTRNLGVWNENYKNVKVLRVGHFKNFRNILGRLEYLLLALIYSLTEDYDIAHLHAFSPGLLYPFINNIRKKPTVFTAHGQGYKIAGINLSGKFLEDLVFYKFPYNMLITVAKKTLTREPRAKKTAVIPNGVNLEMFHLAHRKRRIVKNVTYLGRLSYEKGVDILIEAFGKLKSKSIKLTIIGDGVERKKLKKISGGLNIEFMGSMSGEKLLNKLKETDLLVLPSRTEGHPVTLLEGWASKIPVLATSVGDNRSYIKDGINGFITEPQAGAILQKIREILSSKNLLEISETAYAQVMKYSWQKIAKRTANCYLELL